jgi:sigma-B regulation protein RsbQ
MTATRRHNVIRHGQPGAPPMVFAHGFGCDQSMWRYVWPAFAENHDVVLFDHIGMGGSDASAFDASRYGSLRGYSDDVLDICHELALEDVIFVGHSVSAMIGALAAAAEPELFSRLVLIGPSPRYIDTEDYKGGFSAADIDGLLSALDNNYVGWSESIAPVIMGNEDRPELAGELAQSFCRADPAIAQHFAEVTFRSDNRTDLSDVRTRSLIIQCSDDAIAPEVVGHYVRDHIPGSEFVLIDATGHCPNLSAPQATVSAIQHFLAS